MPFPINLVRWVMNLTYSGQNGPNKFENNSSQEIYFLIRKIGTSNDSEKIHPVNLR